MKLMTLGFLAALLALCTFNANADSNYRATFVFTHLGEEIARQQLDLVDGEEAVYQQLSPGAVSYRLAASAEPAGNGDVFVRLRFSSGRLDSQPRLLVTPGESVAMTDGALAIELQLEPLAGDTQG